MTAITGTLYMDFAPANENGIAMQEIWDAPYFIPLKGGKPHDGYKRVNIQ